MRATSLVCCLIIFSGLEAGGPSTAYADNIPPKANAFLRAYPDFFTGYKENTLLCRDGSGLTFDDGRKKTYEQRLSDADPEDELYQTYPTGPASYAAPAVNFDPGRYRCAALFKKMYGATAKEVESHLTTISWLPHSAHIYVRVTKINGVDRQLAAISAELINSRPKIRNSFSRPGARLTGGRSLDPIS